MMISSSWLGFSSLSLLLLVFASSQQLFNQKAVAQDEETVNRSMFPDDFLFGASTSAYQVEGGYLEDGKGLNNWDVFSHVPGVIANGDNGDMADDHYHRYMEDIEILANLGVDAYRFSISWARILPKGQFSEVNPSGVMFYNKIIDNLLLKGIEPFVTLQHFDIPQELEDKYGGWLSRSIQEDFELFAKTCFKEFGDRVKYWITINEANLLAQFTYMNGTFPPNRCSPPFGNCSSGNSDVEPLIALHNMILSHAKAVKIYREQFQPKQHGRIGIALSAQSYVPYRDDNFSRDAVDRAFITNLAWVLDPLVFGDYPTQLRNFHGTNLPRFNKQEESLVKESIDFIGVNHYSTSYAIDCFHYPTECTSENNRSIQGFVKTTGFRDGIPIGDQAGNPRMFVVPHGMELIMDYIGGRYANISMYVTENGYSPPSRLDKIVELQDLKRVEYFRSYLLALTKAMSKGAQVKGFFVWSLMDNLEWTSGYERTYGLYYVDRRTLERIPKFSAKWYASFLSNKGDLEIGLRSLEAHKVASTKCDTAKAAF